MVERAALSPTLNEEYWTPTRVTEVGTNAVTALISIVARPWREDLMPSMFHPDSASRGPIRAETAIGCRRSQIVQPLRGHTNP